MVIIESLRKRFSHRLESHQIDEDYSPRTSRMHSTTNSITNDIYENEDVPSYEVSQLLHEQSLSSMNLNGMNTNNPSTPIRHFSSNHLNQLTVEHITSLTSSSNISRQNSVVAGSTSETSSSIVINTNSNNTQTSTKSLKNIGLQFLNARQHFALSCCRDLSLLPCIFGLIKSWKMVFIDNDMSTTITSAKLPEHFLTGVWCIVAGYLSYSVLDGLMIRWIVTYSTGAAILRMLSMSTMILTIEQYLVATFSANGYRYGLHIWILISCCLTFVYIVQNFVTSNIDLKGKRRARFFDFYNIVVFAVVPVGLASFITMIGLLRSLLIVRLDIEKERIQGRW